jgi:hypothetical protein
MENALEYTEKYWICFKLLTKLMIWKNIIFLMKEVEQINIIQMKIIFCIP